jgi:transposase InsO family protein
MKIILNSTDKKALELRHSKTRDVRESDLIKAVLLSSEGWSVSQISQAIEFYNHRRFHETLAYKKPMKVYKESILDNNALNIAA